MRQAKDSDGSEQKPALFCPPGLGAIKEMPGLQPGKEVHACRKGSLSREGMVRKKTYRDKQIENYGVF